jgi:hypothetical protein
LIAKPAHQPASARKFCCFSGLTPRWMPLPRDGSKKGDYTIRILKLARPGLLDLYERHINDHVEPIVTQLRAEIAAGNGSVIKSTWLNEAMKWLTPGRPFTALSYDAFDHFISLSERRRWGLRLPRPT